MLVTHSISIIELSPVSSKVYTFSLYLEKFHVHSHSLLDSTSKSFTGYPHTSIFQRITRVYTFHSVLAIYMATAILPSLLHSRLLASHSDYLRHARYIALTLAQRRSPSNPVAMLGMVRAPISYIRSRITLKPELLEFSTKLYKPIYILVALGELYLPNIFSIVYMLIRYAN
jgi:hypothetical protein